MPLGAERIAHENIVALAFVPIGKDFRQGCFAASGLADNQRVHFSYAIVSITGYPGKACSE